MALPLNTWDPQRVVMSLGSIPIEGPANGTFVTVTRPVDGFTLELGAYGDPVRVATNNNSARITVTLLDASPTNAKLSALHRQDLATKDGVRPFSLQDLEGTTLVKGDEAWVVKIPDLSYSNDGTPVREWMIDVASADIDVGGAPA